MKLDYYDPGEVKVSMSPYVEKIIKTFLEEIHSVAVTPAGNYLFSMRGPMNEWTSTLTEEQ